MPSDAGRVAADAELLAAARDRYTGRGDLADQLWWLDHPGTTAPGGAEDPSIAAERAREALYRPGSDQAAAPAVLREADAVAADRAAAEEAVAATLAARPTLAGAEGPGRRRLPVRLLAGTAVAALLVGGAVGLAAGRFGRTPEATGLRALESLQRPEDRPPGSATLPTFIAASRYHLLGSSGTTGTAVYGARARDGRVCLVAVVLAQASYASCTTEAAFAIAGLTLSLHAQVDPEDDSGSVRPREISPHWAPDGSLSF